MPEPKPEPEPQKLPSKQQQKQPKLLHINASKQPKKPPKPHTPPLMQPEPPPLTFPSTDTSLTRKPCNEESHSSPFTSLEPPTTTSPPDSGTDSICGLSSSWVYPFYWPGEPWDPYAVLFRCLQPLSWEIQCCLWPMLWGHHQQTK